MEIAFLGTGLMGSRMAANLARKGHAVTVWNRTAARAEALAGKVAAIAKTPAEAAAGKQVVAACLADPPAVASALLEQAIPALPAGALVIDFSTGSPALAKALDAAARARGARFLESPVTGSKGGAEKGALVLMCGGDAETFAAAKPVLECVSAKQIHIGPVGSASRVKLIGNTFIGLMLEALCEGLVLCQKAGIPPRKMLEVVQASGYASPYWDFKGKAILERDFETHFSVDLMHKDLTLALEAANELKATVPGLAMVREQFQQLRAAGKGGEDIAALIKVLEAQSGLVS